MTITMDGVDVAPAAEPADPNYPPLGISPILAESPEWIKLCCGDKLFNCPKALLPENWQHRAARGHGGNKHLPQVSGNKHDSKKLCNSKKLCAARAASTPPPRAASTTCRTSTASARARSTS